MEQTGEYRIAASRDEVWTALNDPDVLARCLDGCLSMEKIADDRFDARVKARVGPVRATFDAQLTLEDIEPPRSYTIVASVKGGPAGFARGSAHVNLTDEGAETLLQYMVNASIGGKLAQVGSRLVDGAARKMAEDFFSQFREEVGGEGSRSGDRSHSEEEHSHSEEEHSHREEDHSHGEEDHSHREEDHSHSEEDHSPSEKVSLHSEKESFHGEENRSGGEGDLSVGEERSYRGEERSLGEETPSPPPGGRTYEVGGKWMIWLAVFVALLLALLFAF